VSKQEDWAIHFFRFLGVVNSGGKIERMDCSKNKATESAVANAFFLRSKVLEIRIEMKALDFDDLSNENISVEDSTFNPDWEFTWYHADMVINGHEVDNIKIKKNRS